MLPLGSSRLSDSGTAVMGVRKPLGIPTGRKTVFTFLSLSLIVGGSRIGAVDCVGVLATVAVASYLVAVLKDDDIDSIGLCSDFSFFVFLGVNVDRRDLMPFIFVLVADDFDAENG